MNLSQKRSAFAKTFWVAMLPATHDFLTLWFRSKVTKFLGDLLSAHLREANREGVAMGLVVQPLSSSPIDTFLVFHYSFYHLFFFVFLCYLVYSLPTSPVPIEAVKLGIILLE